ncbi:MAG: hypothetical protein BroJett021_52580 [Chloroflexota bacterium]|nr:MAG: hypothetical protein BroJett021_52580 [Chloroflexota bacterium]
MVSLKTTDIDSARMVLRIEESEGGKSRLAKLSPLMPEELRPSPATSRLTRPPRIQSSRRRASAAADA